MSSNTLGLILFKKINRNKHKSRDSSVVSKQINIDEYSPIKMLVQKSGQRPMRPKTDLHTASNCIKIFFSRCSIVRDFQTRQKLMAKRNSNVFSLLMGESWIWYSWFHAHFHHSQLTCIECDIDHRWSWAFPGVDSALLKIYPWGELNVFFPVPINFTGRDFCAILRVHAIFMCYEIATAPLRSCLRVEKYYYNPSSHNVIIISNAMLHVMLSWNSLNCLTKMCTKYSRKSRLLINVTRWSWKNCNYTVLDVKGFAFVRQLKNVIFLLQQATKEK